MNILGIGPLELVFIVVIMILVLGPEQMVSTARKTGAFFRKVVKSPLWHTIMDTSRELRDLPTRIVREAGIEEELKEIKTSTDSLKDLRNISATYIPPSRDSSKKPNSEIVEENDDASLIEEQTSNLEPNDEKLESNDEDSEESTSHEIIPPELIPENKETETLEDGES
jgi:Sec-independent protein translocase protein TatA